MEYSVEERENVIILKLKEDVLVENFYDLKKLLEELIKKNKDIIIDMQMLNYVCSQGLGVITSSLKVLRERGGDIKILKPPPRVLKLLELTRLTKVLQILKDENELK